MSASQSTQYYQLPVYEAGDITSYLDDWNGAMNKLDTAIHEASQGGGGSTINVVQTTGESTADVMSQKAVSDQLALKANTADLPTVPNVVQTTGESETDVMSQKAASDQLALKANTADLPAIPNVVQTTGTSETDVMSQKAVSDALAGAGKTIIPLTFTDSGKSSYNRANLLYTSGYIIPVSSDKAIISCAFYIGTVEEITKAAINVELNVEATGIIIKKARLYSTGSILSLYATPASGNQYSLLSIETSATGTNSTMKLVLKGYKTADYSETPALQGCVTGIVEYSAN